METESIKGSYEERERERKKERKRERGEMGEQETKIHTYKEEYMITKKKRKG